MNRSSGEDSAGPADARRFQTTRWSLIAAAQGGDVADARDALAALCGVYWYPLYAFVRRKGFGADDALDLVQGFFERLIDKGDLISVDRSKGRLRAFLMASCAHYLANQCEHARAQKRGGGRRKVSIDGADAEGRYLIEPSHELTAERLFDRQWAATVLSTVMSRLESELTDAGKRRQFKTLRPALSGNAERGFFAHASAELGISEEAARAAAHRLRQRFRALIRAEILGTVDDPADVDEEIQDLFAALGA